MTFAGLQDGARHGGHRGSGSLPGTGPGYDASLDEGSVLGRTRRVLREARAALDRPGGGTAMAAALVRFGCNSGRCAPALSGVADLVGPGSHGGWALVDGGPLGGAASGARRAIDAALAQMDGMVADIGEGAGCVPVSGAEIDARLGESLAEAGRRLRAGDTGAHDALAAAAGRLVEVSGRGLENLGAGLGLAERAGHLASVVDGRATRAVPAGTVAFALTTVEALAYRWSRIRRN